jgi:hypothetical protein
MITRIVAFVLCTALLPLAAPARVRQAGDDVDLARVFRDVAGSDGTVEERTRRLVRWVNTTFKWSYTDYQKRTVEEIVRRRAGNCAELAIVLRALLDAGGIRSRWIGEINVQPRKESRLAAARERMVTAGNRMSVFGLRHNDHRWLEVQDAASGAWIPADPAVGVVGIHEWIAARMKFADRTLSPVPAIAETSKDMIVPFVVVVLDGRGGKPIENRSKHYLVDSFDAFYGGKLSGLAPWRAWVVDVEKLSALASSAFAGETNLHEHAALIEETAAEYERLGKRAGERGIAAR